MDSRLGGSGLKAGPEWGLRAEKRMPKLVWTSESGREMDIHDCLQKSHVLHSILRASISSGVAFLEGQIAWKTNEGGL
jgi:hypothetical protein